MTDERLTAIERNFVLHSDVTELVNECRQLKARLISFEKQFIEANIKIAQLKNVVTECAEDASHLGAVFCNDEMLKLGIKWRHWLRSAMGAEE